MNSTIPIPWSVPITDYLLFYFVVGVIGFALCFYWRFFLTVVAPILVWLCIGDLRSFYRQDVGSNKLGPDSDYILIVGVSMIFALGTSLLGAYLNWKNRRFKSGI